MLTIPVTILSAIYMCLLTIVYFSKERIPSIENKIYSNMIKLSCLGIILDALSCIFVILEMTETFAFRLITILIFMYYIMWSCLFLLYVYTVSFKKNNMTDQEFNKKHLKNIKVIFYIFLVCAIIIPILPLTYYEDNNVIFPMGFSVDFTYFIAGFLAMAAMLLFMFINRKNIRSKKYVPVYALICLFLVVVVVQKLNPGLILTTTVECFITFLMYFTIENPDVQLINELYKNKKLVEKSNEDTSNFLFRVTQDIKKPVKDIIDISQNMNTKTTKEELIEESKFINNYATQVDYLINKALNISTMDTQKIKIFENKYNSHNLFEEISRRALENVKQNIKFDYTTSSNLPIYLYGDAIKLKQAIIAILKISNEFTQNGFISLDVSTIIKYNICRLIITIEDSGKGISIDRVNQIMSITSEELRNIDVNDLEEQKIDIFAAKKIINLLGGTLMIKSTEGKGTTVIITLDQKVVGNEETELTKKLENYELAMYGQKKVLIVDPNEEESSHIEKVISEKGYLVNTTVYGRDCIEKIRSKQKYDYIIIDDVLPNSSALAVLEELKKVKDFKTPIIVMLNDNKEGIKLHYLKDGFADYIIKSKLDTELARIMKRF